MMIDCSCQSNTTATSYEVQIERYQTAQNG